MLKSAYNWYNTPNKSTFRQYVEAFILIAPLAFLIRTFGYGLYVVPTCSMETTMLAGEQFIADKFTVWFSPIKRGDIIAFNDPNYAYSSNKILRFWQRWVWGPSNWTKRVLGLPGDHVKGVIEDGHPVVYLNGKKLEEPYINKYPIVYTFNIDPRQLRTMSIRELERSTRDWYSPKSYDPSKPFNNQPFYRINPQWIMSDPYTHEPIIKHPGTPLEDGKDVYEIVLKADEFWVLGDNRLGSYDCRSWGPLKAEHIHGKIIYRLLSIDRRNSWWIFDLIQHPIDFWSRVRWDRCFQFVY